MFSLSRSCMRSIIAFLRALVMNGASFARKYFSFIGACLFISSSTIELKFSNTKHALLSPAISNIRLEPYRIKFAVMVHNDPWTSSHKTTF